MEIAGLGKMVEATSANSPDFERQPKVMFLRGMARNLAFTALTSLWAFLSPAA